MSRVPRAVSQGGAGDLTALSEKIANVCENLRLGPLKSQAARRLATHLTLLFAWNRRYSLTAIRNVDDALERHIAESLAPLADLRLGADDCLVDIGSGAGYPGLALLCATEKTGGILVEAREAKVAFLRAVIRETGLSERVTVLEKRLARPEDIPPRATVVTLRAVARPEFWVAGALRRPRVRAAAAWVGEPVLHALASQLKVGAQTFSTLHLPGRKASFVLVATRS